MYLVHIYKNVYKNEKVASHKQDQHENKIWGPIYNVHAIHDLRHFVYIDFLYSDTNLFFFLEEGGMIASNWKEQLFIEHPKLLCL